MYALSRVDLKKCLRNRYVISLFLFLCMHGILHAEPSDFKLQWQAGTQWQVFTSYRQMDGTWSEPKIWTFSTAKADEKYFEVSIASNSPAKALMIVDKISYQVHRIILTDVLRGKELTRELTFESIAPVYPLFSVIPYHMPVLSPGSYVPVYQLNRKINGKSAGSEKLSQKISNVDREVFFSKIPARAKEEWVSGKLPQKGFEVQITKKSAQVYKQFWFPGFPWAVYTESQNMRSWLKK